MQNQTPTPRLTFVRLLAGSQPQAAAWVTGGTQYPNISGLVKFYETPYGGTLVEAEVFGLPNLVRPGSTDFYALHIHEFGDCSQNFTKTGNHYNPTMQMHPDHTGDLLLLMGNQGYAWSSFYDKRFPISSIIGRSVIIHAHRDDFTTQPSGGSGEKIACGIIQALNGPTVNIMPSS